jgi:methyl-accepting chemotaxis protein WspA
MFRKLSGLFTLQRKIVALGLLAALIPSVVLLVVVGLGLRTTYSNMEKDLAKMARADATKAAYNVWLMVKNQDENSRVQVQMELSVANALQAKLGPWSLGESMTWTATNQSTLATMQVTVPKMMLGGKWLGQVKDLAKPVPLVDEVKEVVGAYCTVFVRINEQGDMLRVATNVPGTEGRAIGTYIPAVNADGKVNPIIAKLKVGETYIGRAHVINDWHMAGYQPLKDENGYVFGALYVGTPFTQMESLRESVQNTEVESTPRVYVMGTEGESRGKLWITPRNQSGMTSMWEVRDTSGRHVIQEIIAQAPGFIPGKPEIREFTLQPDVQVQRGSKFQGLVERFVQWVFGNTGGQTEDDGRHIAAVTYYPQWDWVILAQAKAVDYIKITDVVSVEFHQTYRIVLAWCIFLFLATFLASMFIGRRISRPIEQATLIANQIASGKIGNAVRECKLVGLTGKELMTFNSRPPDDSMPIGWDIGQDAPFGDEAIRLRETTGVMAYELHNLISRILGSVEQLALTSQKLAVTTSHQRETSELLSSSIKEVNSAVKQIQSTSQEVLETIGELNTVSSQATGLANAGHASLTGMESTMRDVDKATLNVSSRLAVISQKTDDINLVVTTIGKVAEQTNLLSVNAAIEAEKAGEYGMGFLVVAREIRRMADQTASATGEIEQIVRQVQSAVSAGVMEMDRFTAQVNRGVGDIRKLSGQLAQILDGVRQITQQFETLTQAIESQKRDVNRIVESMAQLSHTSTASDESTEALTAASARLSDATSRLQGETRRFEVDPKLAGESIDQQNLSDGTGRA